MSIETVSLCVLALNEEKFIPHLLNDLYVQTFPRNKTEILLIDSGSTDSTKRIMLDFQKKHCSEYMSIQVLANDKGFQAAGWNVAIRNFKTDVIIRIDAHTHIPADFTKYNMENLQAGEYVSGGKRPCLIEKESAWTKTLLETENSLFGSSINISRRSEKEQYVRTLFHAAYRREVFEKTGLFNEKLLRTEDNEMHYRIRQQGYQICYDPRIISYQYARNSLKRMIQQKYANGYWIALTLGICPRCLSLFYFVPFAFILGIIFTTVLVFIGHPLPAYFLWGAYGLFTLMGTLVTLLNSKANKYTVLMPLLFLLLHISYGVGTIWGLLKMPSFLKSEKEKK